MTRGRLIAAVISSLTVCSLVQTAAGAQERSAPDWNDQRTLELVQRAIERRATTVVDTTLQTYTAEARGYIYFLLDAPEMDRQTLVRTDQVAVNMYWRSPDQLRQRIVGLRERKELPVTGLYYYLDRMTLVQDNFAEGIVIADGDNVDNVPHPISAGAKPIYDYRLTDSLTLRLPGVPDPVQVSEIQVRPRDSDIPAIVGSIFLEEATGALVRMNFTFTPSAYVDPRLDFINVTLENGLWEGRYWLPYEQRLEIRREVPELDLPVGTLIRTRLTVGNYRFNQEVPELLFEAFSPITLAPREQRQNFPFERPIDAEWRLEGIGEPAEVAELRSEARTLIRDRLLTGVPRTRLAVESVSDVFRFNRAEGAFAGFGWGFKLGNQTTLRARGGWAFGADHASAEAKLVSSGTPGIVLGGYLNRREDVGGFTPTAGLTNTVSSLLFGDDWFDPYFASGLEASAELPLRSGWSVTLNGRLEQQESADLTTEYAVIGESGARPVLPIDEGTHTSLGVGLQREVGTVSGGWRAELQSEAGLLAPDRDTSRSQQFGRVRVDLGSLWTRSERRASLDLQGSAGIAFGELPVQETYLLGGRSTLPGFDHRQFGGDRFLLGRATASADLAHPWIRARGFGALGWTGADAEAAAALAGWGAAASDGLRASVGAGVGLFYDLLRVDFARGLGAGGRTQLIVELQPRFWDFL